MKFKIEVTRVGYANHLFEVEADSKEEADAKALEAADNHIFDNEHYSETLLTNSFENEILIVVEGGVVGEVFATHPAEISVVLRDYDVDGAENDYIERGELHKEDDNNDTYREVNVTPVHYDFLITKPFKNPVKENDEGNPSIEPITLQDFIEVMGSSNVIDGLIKASKKELSSVKGDDPELENRIKKEIEMFEKVLNFLDNGE